MLRDHGADVLEVPVSRWVPHPDRAALDRAVLAAHSFDWILFAHPCAVDFFLARFLQARDDLRELGPVRLGTYGPMTAEKLREWHLRPAAVSADHKTPLILEALAQCGGVRGQRFLVLRGDTAQERVPEALSDQGARVEVAPCYAIEPEPDDTAGRGADLLENGADWLVFASGLAIEHFHERFDLPQLASRFPGLRVALAGESIQWALDRLGLKPSVIARPNDVNDLANRIVSAETGPGTRKRKLETWTRITERNYEILGLARPGRASLERQAIEPGGQTGRRGIGQAEPERRRLGREDGQIGPPRRRQLVCRLQGVAAVQRGVELEGDLAEAEVLDAIQPGCHGHVHHRRGGHAAVVVIGDRL